MITVSGAPVLSMRLAFPVSGLWTASLELDSEDVVSGAVELEQDGGRPFAATILHSGVVAGVCRVAMVGGAGGLTNDIVACSYRDTTARTVLEEALAAAGETYDAASTRSVMTATLPYWTRAAGRATTALWALADALGGGTRWRVQPSGAVWMGVDAWAQAPEYEYVELDRDHAAGQVLIAPDQLDILPGMQLPNGDRVGRIVYTVTRSEPLRATYNLES